MRLLLIGILFTFFLFGCSGEEVKENLNPSEQTNKLRESNDTSIVSESKNDTKQGYQITFNQKESYGSTENVIVGEIASLAVDNQNRVYIADMDQTTVHIFNSKGNYLKSLGRKGKGPAEFAAITPNTIIKAHSNRLYALDYSDPSTFFPTRVQIFTLSNLSFSHTLKLIAPNRDDFGEQLEGYYPNRIFPRNDGKFLVSYRKSPTDYQDSTSFIRYVIQDSTGRIVEGPVLEQKDRTNLVYLVEKARVPYLAIYSFPFLDKSLLAVSKDNYLYAARSGDFQVDVYNPDGQHVREFSHLFENKPFNKDTIIERYKRTNYKSELGDGVAIKMIKEAENLPDTWPALQSMFFDDKDMLWVSTIINDNEVYEWWILKKTGEVITKFKWARNKPIKVIKNGFLYTLETDDKGVKQIVRYKINFEKQ